MSYLDDELSSVFGKRSDLGDETTALAFYTATAGNIDRLMRVIHLAAARALDYELEKLDSNVLAEAYEVELRAERPKEENPFGEWTGPSTKPPANRAEREREREREDEDGRLTLCANLQKQRCAFC